MSLIGSPVRGVGRLLAVGAAVAMTVLLGACGADTPAPGDASSAGAEGPWSFTDDRGTKIDLPKRPTRIVAQSHPAAALYDFGIKPVGVFGPQKTADGKPSPQIGNLDLTGVESVGTAFGEFQLEKLIALKPDLIVTVAYGPMIWYIPDEVRAKVEKIAPIAVIQLMGVAVPDAVKRFGDLSAALGADPDSPAIRQARTDFETAANALKAAVAAKPGLSVAVVSGTKENFFVADPEFHGDVKYLQQLGLQIVKPGKPEAGFESLSWEEAGRYKADLVLEDARPEGGLDSTQMATYPAWQNSPAVKANQVVDWQTETPFTYQRFTKVLTDTAAAVTKADAAVVP
ncbi:ABC transporter substrate-binding protein [Micromonospora inyonensis]|uniref:Iron complex transport system substrate-binding protein n=1 Tax=Micromonospora inyonensis TaxID=47866 RepID=A0A1C6S7I7_9ACTN|nr:ABC transporter substrate-binding protein [Micromonospora inyonensis]SCL25257.1 iron complex transport system substrate-binding protein [Micromonospora inyonensis]